MTEGLQKGTTGRKHFKMKFEVLPLYISSTAAWFVTVSMLLLLLLVFCSSVSNRDVVEQKKKKT